MTLPASGTISMSQVSTELGRASNAQTSLGETAVRNLAGVASGAIAFSNLHGKSAFSIVNNTSISVSGTAEFPNFASAGITYETNGNIQASTSDAGSYDAGDWGTPNTTGAGNGYYIRASNLSGNAPSGPAFNQWHPLSSARAWNYSTQGSLSCTFTVEISADQSTILDSHTVALSAQSV